MFLHLIDDVSQANYLVRRTNKLFAEEHLFYVFTKNGKFKKVDPVDNVKAFNPTKKSIRLIASTLNNYNGVFIHRLCRIKAKIINISPKETVFIWVTWGMDYYNVYPSLYSDIFLPYTKLVNLVLFKFSLTAKYLFYHIHTISKYIGLKSADRNKEQAAKHIKYVFNNMPEHSDVFKILNLPMENRFDGTYYSIEAITKDVQNSAFTLGNNIFIGNSASNSSNHLDVFIHLKKLGLNESRIIVPLSYNCPRYANFINLAGKLIFKEKFVGLTKFYALEKYNEILLSCNVLIFNQKRAQAVGNIIFGIWAGHKIFLRKTNPIYDYLKSLNIIVFSIEEELNIENLIGLNRETQLKNREIIEANYCEAKVSSNYELLLNSLTT